MMQLHLCTHGTEDRHHIRKSVTSPETAADRSHISKLYTDDMFHRVGKRTFRVSI